MRCINADELLSWFNNHFDDEMIVTIGYVTGLINDSPTIDPERKTGKWIDDCECSVCHWINEDDGGDTLLTYYNYCPNCGTKMEEGEQE